MNAKVAHHNYRHGIAFTPLIGREQDVAKICALIEHPEVRLLTLTGTAGVGKTRLAIEIAYKLREIFIDGCHFVPLASVKDLDLVFPTIAQALGLKKDGTGTSIDLLKSFIKDKHLLLLLDNFEQLLEAAHVLTGLLSILPNLKILVTSRAVLHVQGEYTFQIPPLAVPDLGHLPEVNSLTQYSSITLFVQRAKAINPAFQLTVANARAIAEICVMLDGLPLALELAAARTRLLPPNNLLAEMGRNRLQMLTSGGAYPVRQQTLRNTLAWSYDLLTIDEQELFRRISIFVGGCTLEAVEVVSHDGGDQTADVLNTLTSLIDKSLLLQREEGNEEQHFFMLDTIREFGLYCLDESGETERIRRSHAQYFLARVEETEPNLKEVEQSMWLMRLERERENLQVALEWIIDEREAEFALRFCGALWWFWFLRGYWSEGRHWLKQAFGLLQDRQPTEERVKAFCGAGCLAYYQGDFEEARSMLEESVKFCRMLGLKQALANALGTLGMIMQVQGDLAAIDQLLEESEALYGILSSSWELSYLQGKLGQLALQRSELQLAEGYAKQSLEVAQTLGDKTHLTFTLYIIGYITLLQGNLKEAATRHKEGLSLSQQIGNKVHMGMHLIGLSKVSAAEGKLERAARLLGAAAARIDINLHMNTLERTDYDLNLVFVRAQLGDDNFTKEWNEGYTRISDQDLSTLELISTPQITSTVPPSLTPIIPKGLTQREVEVLRLIAQGLSDTQIAEKLVISRRTVNTHITSIYRKIEVSSRSSAVRYALDIKLVNGPD